MQLPRGCGLPDRSALELPDLATDNYWKPLLSPPNWESLSLLLLLPFWVGCSSLEPLPPLWPVVQASSLAPSVTKHPPDEPFCFPHLHFE